MIWLQKSEQADTEVVSPLTVCGYFFNSLRKDLRIRETESNLNSIAETIILRNCHRHVFLIMFGDSFQHVCEISAIRNFDEKRNDELMCMKVDLNCSIYLFSYSWIFSAAGFVKHAV